MLTTMIESFYNFKKLPFAKNLTPSEIFTTDAAKELHSRLEYMKDRRGILVITGLSGVGKTLQLRAFTDSLSAACYFPVYLPLSTVTVSDFYRQINASLGGERQFRKIDVFASIQQQIKHLVSHEKKVPVIILDECHRLSRDALLELQIIANFQMDSIDPALFILADNPNCMIAST
jgi:type II secretory pathway predicted ATPase ExeA